MLFVEQTGVALGIEVDDKMPQHEYYEYFGPDYNLHVAPSNMENKNSRPLLDEIRERLLDYLSKLQHAPSAQFQERPPDTQLLEDDEDQDDGDDRWDRDSDMDSDDDRKALPGRVKREYIESEPKNLAPTVMAIDEPSIKVEQDNSNKSSDQHTDMNS